MDNIFYGMGGVPDLRRSTGGVLGMGGSSIPGLGQALGGANTYEAMTPGGGMDVLGSLRNHSNVATQFQRFGGTGPTMGPGAPFGGMGE